MRYIALALLLAGCSSQPTVPAVGSATAEVKTVMPARPELEPAEPGASPDQEAQALVIIVDRLLKYSLKLECVLTPFVENPRADSCLETPP